MKALVVKPGARNSARVFDVSGAAADRHVDAHPTDTPTQTQTPTDTPSRTVTRPDIPESSRCGVVMLRSVASFVRAFTRLMGMNPAT